MPVICRVPWMNIQEWKDVKNKVCSSDHRDWVRAYQIMLMWKIRCPKLPANVECTIVILQVLIQSNCPQSPFDEDEQVVFAAESNLQLMFSTAIVRFVNHIMIPTKSSFYSAASEQNIPDWVVNLRHDVSHSGSLPSLELLQDAAVVAKAWLIDNYWIPQEANMFPVDGSELIAKTAGPVSVSVSIEKAIKSCLSCWFICQKRLCKDDFATVSELTASEWRSLVDLKKFLETSTSLKGTKSFLKKMDSQTQLRQSKNKSSLQILLNSLHKFLESLTKNKHVMEPIVNSLLDAGFLKNEDIELVVWSPILEIIHGIDSMEFLLQTIFRKLVSGTCLEKKCANSWLSILLRSLNSVKKRRRAQQHENEAVDSGVSGDDDLNLETRKPPRLSYEVFRSVLTGLDPSSNAANVISRFIPFVRPKIGKEARLTISSLLTLYTSDFSEDTETLDMDTAYSMYSVEDLTTGGVSEEEQVVPEKDDNIWTLVDIDVEVWNKCPIGLLPHQKELDLSLPDMVWREVRAESRKRKADYLELDE